MRRAVTLFLLTTLLTFALFLLSQQVYQQDTRIQQSNISEEDAVQAALQSVQLGGAYIRLLGEPEQVFTEYLPGTPAHWRIALQGVILETVPAAPPDIPESYRTHPYLVALVDDGTGEVQQVEVFPSGLPPNIKSMKRFVGNTSE